MIRLILRGAAGALAFVSAVAAAEGQRADEEIAVSREPTGLHSLTDPNFKVVVRPDGQVSRRRSLYGHRKVSEHTDRFEVSPDEAAAFAAALLRLRPIEPGYTLFCQGQSFGADEVVMVRGIPVFEVRWTGLQPPRIVQACYNPDEHAIVAAVEEGLRAIDLTLDGERIEPASRRGRNRTSAERP
jgi:hypothetical protein